MAGYAGSARRTAPVVAGGLLLMMLPLQVWASLEAPEGMNLGEREEWSESAAGSATQVATTARKLLQSAPAPAVPAP